MLIVFAELPGTGKTTLSRLVAAPLRAALIRVDAIEAAVRRSSPDGPPVGALGYVIAQEVTRCTLAVGTSVVVDAVNPVPEARAGWRTLAASTGNRLVMVEVVLHEPAEHRRRIEQRRSDLPGLVVPTWRDVLDHDYQAWDTERDGDRLVVDGLDTFAAVEAVLAALG